MNTTATASMRGEDENRLPLESAPEAYEMFQQKKDGCVKVVLRP